MLVQAQALTVPALLDGLARGHAVLTCGPVLTLSGPPEAPLLPGDCIPAAVDLHLRWQGAAEGRLRLVTGQRGAEGVRLAADTPVGPQGAAVLPAGLWSGADWAMVELRDAAGGMQALVNPVFVGDCASRPTSRSGRRDAG